MNPLFEAGGIQASYMRKNDRIPLFSAVSFCLEAATVYDLVGPSGSGKSTLLRICARMLESSGGTLMLDGIPSGEYEPTTWRSRVCLVPQKPTIIAGTVRDNLLLPWTFKVNNGQDIPTDEVLNDLLGKAKLSDIELDRNAVQVSGGQAARIALLRAFATRPSVLLLDEVDAALDSESAHAIGGLTKELVGEDMTCLRIRHRAADGFAAGVFSLRDGALSYAPNVVGGGR